ncbi:hypothetical protein KM043_014823 [Ampulex compressa]|nr:hypothetical protein KM043_014823 [Ampulex compressa]
MIVEKKSRNTEAPAPKYKIAHSEKLGRYMVAGRNLAEGEVILRENPIVVGPTIYNGNYFCFACLRLLPVPATGIPYACSKCRVATLCNSACEEGSSNHTAYECRAFQSNATLSASRISEIINILLPLRLWLVKEHEPTKWKKIESLEAHVNERRDTEVWREREILTIDAMKALHLIPEDGTSEIMQHLCGILDVNTFELRSPGGFSKLPLRGLYIEASIMAHDCIRNTHLTLDDSFQLTIYASRPIKEGDPILFNYTSSLLGTADRREHLRKGKYFECECTLCKDPYELGSNMSTILCPRCKKGLIAMQDPLAINPYARESRWRCNMCRQFFGGRLINATVCISKTLIDQVDESSMKDLEALVKKLSRSLHSNHFLLLSLKQKLLLAYRKEVTSVNPPRKIVQRMLDMCKEVYDVLEIVEPGISRLKGIMLYEMHLPLVLLANRAYAAREISSVEWSCRVEEAASTLKKGVKMLLLEPAATPEGQLAKCALQQLKELNQNITDVKLLPSEEPKTRKLREHRRRVK